ncbi:hypothetical protein Tco_0955910 [Tanacetum coccineum]|uniref:Uncharacterized protein n=1 Tax=Tanacetum coccineum TaxID=301880 RepID=A0ABQ5E8L4_9ASTR
MHTTMVPVQVKTLKIQAGVQVSRQGELGRHLQLWKHFGSALEDFICVVFVHDRNIVKSHSERNMQNFFKRNMLEEFKRNVQFPVKRNISSEICRTSKDNEDPRWSTSFKTKRTQKTSLALEALGKTLFVL